MGESVKEVLPTTTVTEANRDGLFGRIPRRVTEDIRYCDLLFINFSIKMTFVLRKYLC